MDAGRCLFEQFIGNAVQQQLPYQAYIDNLLSFGQEAKKSQLSALLWHRNTSEHFDTCRDTNLGYTKRKALAAESKEIDMMGKLHLDLFFQNRYLLHGVEMRLRLIRSNDLFVCIETQTSTK